MENDDDNDNDKKQLVNRGKTLMFTMDAEHFCGSFSLNSRQMIK